MEHRAFGVRVKNQDVHFLARRLLGGVAKHKSSTGQRGIWRVTGNDLAQKGLLVCAVRKPVSITDEIPNDVVAVNSDLPDDLKDAIYTAIEAYLDTEEGEAVFDEI